MTSKKRERYAQLIYRKDDWIYIIYPILHLTFVHVHTLCWINDVKNRSDSNHHHHHFYTKDQCVSFCPSPCYCWSFECLSDLIMNRTTKHFRLKDSLYSIRLDTQRKRERERRDEHKKWKKNLSARQTAFSISLIFFFLFRKFEFLVYTLTPSNWFDLSDWTFCYYHHWSRVILADRLMIEQKCCQM